MNKRFVTTWKYIRRSPYQALAAIAVLTVTFLAASIFSLLILGSHQILSYFETRPQVTAFFTETATTNDINSLKKNLESKPFVSKTKYVSKDEALAIYREQNKNDPLLLEMVTAQILPASLEVSGTSAEVLPQIAESMSGEPGVEEVVYQKDVIETLKIWTKSLRISGLVLVGFLMFTSTLIMIIIISMKIAVRRKEIEVLKLLGASSWYIKNPFLIEGVFYGTTGVIIAWVTTYILLLYSTPFLVSFLGDIPLLPVPIQVMLVLLGVQTLFGALIGSLGSYIAVRRFLRS